ncbi:MAG: phosphoribosyltransferase [Sphingobacteriales bacterium]|nr:MAG: phosphoribosyltransferase [Sphingobacteriales bacterium]
MQKHLLLDAELIRRKLDRMAFEIWERFSSEDELVLLGIEPHGMVVAEALAEALRAVAPLRITVQPLTVDKKAPLTLVPEITLNLTGKAVVLVDDVANSGKTLFYALRPLLQFDLRALLIAVLVDRKHKSFPIQADVVGQTVATTLKDHIEVETRDGRPVAAYFY